MIYYTKYAKEKFSVLQEHKFSLTKEDIESVLRMSESVRKFDKKLWLAEGRYSDEYNLRVIFEKDSSAKKVITFYPVKK